jgi:hypothetical protein
MVPAALVAGGWVDLVEGGPQAERTVAHREQRRLQAAVPEVTQDVRPGVRALAVAEGHAEQLLVPVGAGTDDHEQAARLGLETGAEVDPVRPAVGERALDRSSPPGGVVGLPGRLEAQDRRARQRRLLAEQLPEGRLEVPRAQAL